MFARSCRENGSFHLKNVQQAAMMRLGVTFAAAGSPEKPNGP